MGENEKLKQVRYLEIRSVEDLYSELTRQILNEAMMVEEMMAKLTRKFSDKYKRRFY